MSKSTEYIEKNVVFCFSVSINLPLRNTKKNKRSLTSITYKWNKKLIIFKISLTPKPSFSIMIQNSRKQKIINIVVLIHLLIFQYLSINYRSWLTSFLK
jgi:hypothetical protein